MPLDNEKSLIADVHSGNVEAFAPLVRAYQSRVRLACLVLLGNVPEADDAAQDVFLKAFKGLGKFRGDSSFITWILHIADHHCLDILRSRARRKTDSLETLLADHGPAFEAFLARQTADHAPSYTTQEWDLMAKLFAALPIEDREILTLREIELLSYDAISARLHCSLDAVKGRLKRARQDLMEKCRHYF